MWLITGGVLIRWCSLLGAPEAQRVLHPVRLQRETINHQNGSETGRGLLLLLLLEEEEAETT